jgi:hypothetical protein
MSANDPAGNTSPSGSVVKVGPKKCKPFIFEVMVYSTEAGYRAEVVVEKGCSATNDAIWKFVFDLTRGRRAEPVSINFACPTMP